jgi:hypothetical protein
LPQPQIPCPSSDLVSFFYTESTSSRISYHFTVKYLYAGYNDVELIKQAL